MKLLEQHRIYKLEVNQYVKSILENPVLVANYIQLALKSNLIGAINIAWILKDLADTQPIFLNKSGKLLLELLKKYRDVAGVARPCVSIFNSIEITEETEGELYKICFYYLENAQTTIAVKAFSMTVCYHIAKKHRDLLPELKIVVEEILKNKSESSPGLRSRGMKTIKAINQYLH